MTVLVHKGRGHWAGDHRGVQTRLHGCWSRPRRRLLRGPRLLRVQRGLRKPRGRLWQHLWSPSCAGWWSGGGRCLHSHAWLAGGVGRVELQPGGQRRRPGVEAAFATSPHAVAAFEDWIGCFESEVCCRRLQGGARGGEQKN